MPIFVGVSREKRKPIKVLTNYGGDNGGGYTSSKKISWIMIHLYEVRYIQQKVRFILSPNYNVIKQKVIFMDLKEKKLFLFNFVRLLF